LVVLFAAVALLGLGVRKFRLGPFTRAIRVVRGSLVLVGFSALWMIPELGYIAVRSSTHEAREFHAHPRIPGSVMRSRIVWLVFDELSYDQTYEHRWAGLNLPSFDRLRLESVTFSDVLPAGTFTKSVIPSLFLGRQVSQTRISAAGEFAVYLDNDQQWHRFEASQTIFADARRLGWSSGIAGWYIPYCRIMAGWIDSCSWSYQAPLPENMSPRQGLLRNAAAPFLTWLHGPMPNIVSDRYSFEMNEVRGHQRDYQSVLEQAQALLRDSTIRFAYVHLGVPHLPAIYDRQAQGFSMRGSYLDNLALADEALGRLLDTLEGTPAWSNTTVIVCGDHSWRGFGGKLTGEEEAASKGRFDARPVLSVHFPDERFGSQVTRQFPEFALHEMIERLLGGQIGSADDLARWTLRAGTT
jgi:hypothetical protein